MDFSMASSRRRMWMLVEMVLKTLATAMSEIRIVKPYVNTFIIRTVCLFASLNAV
jgi:hypothetical protein